MNKHKIIHKEEVKVQEYHKPENESGDVHVDEPEKMVSEGIDLIIGLEPENNKDTRTVGIEKALIATQLEPKIFRNEVLADTTIVKYPRLMIVCH